MNTTCSTSPPERKSIDLLPVGNDLAIDDQLGDDLHRFGGLVPELRTSPVR